MAENDCDCPTCQQEKYWDQNELDAQRYRKIRAKLIPELFVEREEIEWTHEYDSCSLYVYGPDFDSAVDALPEPENMAGKTK